DLPLAAPLLDALVAAPSGVAVVATEAGRPQPLCARYPRERALAAAERLLAEGRLPARGLPHALGATRVAAAGDALLHLNSPRARGPPRGRPPGAGGPARARLPGASGRRPAGGGPRGREGPGRPPQPGAPGATKPPPP